MPNTSHPHYNKFRILASMVIGGRLAVADRMPDLAIEVIAMADYMKEGPLYQNTIRALQVRDTGMKLLSIGGPGVRTGLSPEARERIESWEKRIKLEDEYIEQLERENAEYEATEEGRNDARMSEAHAAAEDLAEKLRGVLGPDVDVVTVDASPQGIDRVITRFRDARHHYEVAKGDTAAKTEYNEAMGIVDALLADIGTREGDAIALTGATLRVLARKVEQNGRVGVHYTIQRDMLAVPNG